MQYGLNAVYPFFVVKNLRLLKNHLDPCHLLAINVDLRCWGVNKFSQNLEAHIEELEFITIDDQIYLRDRDRLRLLNKQAAKLEKDKRDIKWRVSKKYKSFILLIFIIVSHTVLQTKWPRW